MPSTGIPAGILSALSFGAGDFAGAVAARRAGALVVVAGAQGIGLIALLIAAAILRPAVPPIDGDRSSAWWPASPVRSGWQPSTAACRSAAWAW